MTSHTRQFWIGLLLATAFVAMPSARAVAQEAPSPSLQRAQAHRTRVAPTLRAIGGVTGIRQEVGRPLSSGASHPDEWRPSGLPSLRATSAAAC